MFWENYVTSVSLLLKWIKSYSQVWLEDNRVMTFIQIPELQKHDAQLEEGNHILKKAIAVFMQNYKRD